MNKFLLFISIYSLLFAMNINGSTVSDEKIQISWTCGADIPLPRGGYFAAWHNNGLWLAGGSYWKDGKKLWTDEASFYDPENKSWSKAKPIPKAFGYGVTASVGRDLYLFGGTNADGNLNKDIYRLRGENWSRVGESPAGFIYAAYSTIGSKVYIFGGSTGASDVTKAVNETWIYDTKTNKWKKSNPFPGAPRQTFSAAAIGKKIYIFGGVTQKAGEKFYNLDDAFYFDTKNEKWSKIKKMPLAMRAFWAVSDGKRIYLIGGYSDQGLDSVYLYSPAKDEYELVSKLPQPLMDTKFIFNGNFFYGASGEDKLASRFTGMVVGSLKKFIKKKQ